MEMLSRPRKLVVAALIQNQRKEVLLTKRMPQNPMPGYWELPGGKVEPLESPEEALSREILEEIGVIANVGKIYDVVFYRYPDFDLLMLVYSCEIEQMPQAIEVAEVHWVHPRDFSKYQVLPADEPLLMRLRYETPR